MSGFGSSYLQKELDNLSLGGSTRHKIIIGIDYGTTFSGVSYVTTDKSNIDDVNIISTWPGESHTTYKTPTRIAYKRENSKLSSNKWGFEVGPKLISYSWTKLLLDRNATAGEFDDPALSNMSGEGMMKLPRFRDAPGVCEDFLHELYDYVSSKLRRQMTDATFDNTPMECWVTLPAIWSEEAKVATLVSARKAGFGNRPGDEIFTIAEPEAAAIATLKQYSEDAAFNRIKPNEHILICDCGGGTVDITTYTVAKVEPVLEFDELCVGVGGKCGATYIDRNLHTFLSRRFGTAFDEVPMAQKGPGSKFMTSFETIKRDFGRTEDQDQLELSPLKLNTESSDYYDDEDRIVMLTYQEMQSLFDPVVKEITNLVGQQVREAKAKNRANINRIILVGGFGESPYLNKALAEWCQRNGQITLMCPEQPQTAVVRGAALRGLEGVTPRIKKARKHYGIELQTDFEEGVDPEEKRRISDFDDRQLCRHRMTWLIVKGEKISQDTIRTQDCCQEYTPGTSVSTYFKLYSSTLDDPPRYSTDSRVEEVGNIVSNFPANFDYGPHTKFAYNTRLQKTIHLCSHKVQIRFGDKGENLTFKNVVNGKTMSTATIEFNRH